MNMRLLIFLLSFSILQASAQRKTRNVIVITTDGFRWQELFNGMDTALANNKKFNEGDSAYIYEKYWSENAKERRQKLMPFMWSTISTKGQIYGNRNLGSRVDNKNPYWFSYPGYSELMTGYVDTAINSNGYPANPNENILSFLNRQSGIKNKVAAFGAWYAFDRILNEKPGNFPVFSAFDSIGGKTPTQREKLINSMMKDSYQPWLTDECLDVFTHFGAMEWLKTRKPRVLYIAYGETDEWAHSGKYRSYLDAAKQVDKWLAEIWAFVQSDPQYKNKTTILITTDHGRGDLNKHQWTSHGSDIPGAGEIWLAIMGPDTRAKGEVSKNSQIFLEQCAQTIAWLMNVHFKTTHPVAEQIDTGY
jgi:hypothetical protein